mmetsp:Transcript_93858/g.176422  ORF Transcript_93858/g.176422 Transcript_93858/m.176422 type:complete len:363 (+) Transcript_93858:38-1126(+)
MCGRGACTLSAERCRRVAGCRTRDKVRGSARLRPRYNMGPQNYVPVIRHASSASNAPGSSKLSDCDGGCREVSVMRWGLVPSFAKRAEDFDVFKGGSSTFNTRVEGAEASGLWRRLLDKRRCVVLFDGFYEWKAVGKGKVPMFIRHKNEYEERSIALQASPNSVPGSPCKAILPETLAMDMPPRVDKECSDGPRHAPLLLAGLYDVWQAPTSGTEAEEAQETVSILTMDPDGTPMTAVHDRMPVFLTPETAALWLEPSARWADILREVLQVSQAHAKSQLLLYEVSTLVSNIRNESPDCLLPKKDYDARQLSKGIGRFFQRKSGTSGGLASPAAVPDAEDKAKAKRQAEESIAPPPKVICLD